MEIDILSVSSFERFLGKLRAAGRPEEEISDLRIRYKHIIESRPENDGDDLSGCVTKKL